MLWTSIDAPKRDDYRYEQAPGGNGLDRMA